MRWKNKVCIHTHTHTHTKGIALLRLAAPFNTTWVNLFVFFTYSSDSTYDNIRVVHPPECFSCAANTRNVSRAWHYSNFTHKKKKDDCDLYDATQHVFFSPVHVSEGSLLCICSRLGGRPACVHSVFSGEVLSEKSVSSKCYVKKYRQTYALILLACPWAWHWIQSDILSENVSG